MVKASRHLCLFSRQPLLIIMVFSSEDWILTEQLHRSKGYGARKLGKEFPEKGWKVCSVGRLLKKLRIPVRLAVKLAVEDCELQGRRKTSWMRPLTNGENDWERVSMHRVVTLNTLCSIASIYFATQYNWLFSDPLNRLFSEPPTFFEENNVLSNL